MADVSNSGWINARQFHEADGVADWRVVGEGACAYFRTVSFAAGAQLVQAISDLPGVEHHPPAVDLRFSGVTVRLITITPGYYGLGERDLTLARQISAAARKLGIPADPSRVQNVQFAINTLVGPQVLPFWRAVLDYQDRGDDPGELIDPRARGPLVYYQHMGAPPDAPQPQRGLHVDLWIAHDQAQARIAAALAAGGRLVTERCAPSWSTLEDIEGNRVCVCTWVPPAHTS
jgi:4a-hydroxytetrahydrobiopterin dehydratase